jgi:GT2 family glycosyltransferase
VARVSVVIPAYGDDPWLERAVASVLASAGVDVDAVVVDNGAGPATIERLAARAGVTVVRPGSNLGFAGGCNAGAAVATGDIVAFLNQDAMLDPDALAALAATATRPDVGIATASIRLADDPGTVNSAGNPLHFLGFGWAGGHGEPATRYGIEGDVLAASGTGMAVRADVWRELGGFAEEYFAYLEDAELSLRCWQRGLRVVYVPEARVVHRYEFSRNPDKLFLLERNRLVLVLTAYEGRTLGLLAPALIGAEAGMVALSARDGWARQKVASLAWLVRHHGWIRQRRRRLQSERTVPDGDLAGRLEGRFSAAALDLPRWARPADSLLAAYWWGARRMLRRSGPRRQ